ncbi:MAG: hypothetical protein GY797_18155 [Deltaproteobacteria bacterium]|nr:hypothetical protein [Deltaproteobacteria bacterium]
MTDEERLAQIIKTNPGATAYIDNDNWQLNKPEPPEYDDWSEDKQEDWYKSCQLAGSRDFPTLGISYGYGLLEAMGLLLKIKIEGV